MSEMRSRSSRKAESPLKWKKIAENEYAALRRVERVGARDDMLPKMSQNP
jgi:hypothetical protein